MKEQELKELIDFKNKPYERNVAIPNSLFDDLKQLVQQKKLKKQHIGFTYSYIYLITYLARYSKYDRFIPSVKMIKEILGYSPINKAIDYIIKENGLLDSVGITKTINDFPVVTTWENDYNNYNKAMEITFASELQDINEFKNERYLDVNIYKLGNIDRSSLSKPNKNTKCKLPVFAFHNNPNETDILDGLFFNADGEIPFTLLDFNVFAFCMSKPEELGCNAFYIYSFLKHKNDIFKDGYDRTAKDLSIDLLLSHTTIEKYRDNMRSYQMMILIHNMEHFVLGINELERRASTNKINPYEWFSDEKVEYKKLKRINLKQYEELKEQKAELQEVINDLDNNLPFI